ncbi:plasmid pRiA4b ORF-3 family protein [Pseudarthrobacter sp. SSS035]|uniref:plasmid pRiA4b ORF-3 family protein n=1 Tax=Pseudarthrobacter sp. SSS035 TaxID=2931399 RepID=UPI002010689A|nr:plasmid pRiA4b ORF-3 family protein [Pseudarthrobacter sp. SSS035]
MQLSVPAFDLRISITDTEPLIWRRLQVPVTLTVPEFHLAVQAAFGWENSHLYAVRCVDRAGKPREIVGPQDLTEDLDAEPASGVVLSELLDAQKPGSALEYEYDFGDSWTHHVEVFGSADLPAGELLCVDGATRGPVEDSGGPHGYQRLLQIVADPEHPEHADATSWIFGATGEYGSHFAPATFDPQAANRKLRLLSLQWWPQPLADEERDAVLLPVRWLLENAAPDGLELTKDGYLKPAMVKRAMDELGWSDPIMGKGNRETHARPVLELRLHLIDWKLLRKFKGRLVLTPRGKRCLERPAELWDYLVDAVGRQEHDAVRLVTRVHTDWHLSGIAPTWNREREAIRGAMLAAGFVTRSGHPIPDEWVSDINRVVRWNFECLHLTAPKVAPLDRALLTDGGVKFLLAAQAVGRSV